MTRPEVPAVDAGESTIAPDDHPAARLLSAPAIRERCARVMGAAERGEAAHFSWHPERLDGAAAYVAAVIRRRYPDLRVPIHSRWRHFEAGGVDRFGALAAAHTGDADERARIAIDLVVPSVLLDAGAGARWRYEDRPNGVTLARSEGLGVASLALFASGALSADPRQPLRADASALATLDDAIVARAFQVADDNPLVGVSGRVALLRSLGAVAMRHPQAFGEPARIGNLLDTLRARADGGRLPAATLLHVLLRALLGVWPSRLSLAGVPLGDCWRHPAARRDPADPTDGFVPFHKLTQWLAYSMIEPLRWGGIEVTGLDALTGLPEYRNGGLLLDLGVLAPVGTAPDALARTPLAVDSEAIVEWRALTVIALDRLAARVRSQLHVDAAGFPLARVLEGGTWAAGRTIAAERREGGVPPIAVDSDGTVF